MDVRNTGWDSTTDLPAQVLADACTVQWALPLPPPLAARGPCAPLLCDSSGVVVVGVVTAPA